MEMWNLFRATVLEAKGGQRGLALVWSLSMRFVACKCSHLLEQPGNLMVGPWGLFLSSDMTLRGWSWMIFSVLCSRGLVYSSSCTSSHCLTLVQPKNCKWKIEQGFFFLGIWSILGECTDGSLVPLTWWYQQNNPWWAAGKMQAGGCDWSLTFQGELKEVCSPQSINTAVTILICSTWSI